LVAATLGILAQLAIVARAPVDTARPVNFHAVLMPDTVYVGQQATYQVGVFIEDALRLRLRHNPEFVPPDAQGMLAYELGGGRGPAVRRVGRRSYEVHVFERAFFPLAPGRYAVPSAQLIYSLPLSISFFSREETHTLVAESLGVVAVPPPAAGRPDDFTGAVGDLSLAARLDSTVARVGDPMLLTVSVMGRGNVKLLPRPAVAVPWGSTVAGPERVTIDTATDEVRGVKEFDWLVTPRDSGDLAFPAVRYPYFNPYSERYEVAVTSPALVHVHPGALALGDTARSDAAPALSIRTAYTGPLGTPFYEEPLFFALAALAPLPAVLLAVRRRPRRTPRRLDAAAALHALARGRSAADAATVRRHFVRALVGRFGLAPTAFTDGGALAHALRREGVTGRTADGAEAILAQLDRLAFGPAATAVPDLCDRADAIYRQVLEEARSRPTRGRPMEPAPRTRALALLVAAAATTTIVAARALRALDAAAAAHEFMAGVRAYESSEYRAAAVHFSAAAALSPRAADAWADAGTAAWVVGDSAAAVIGWQHAGRLEPLASDIRERLALVRAPQDGPIARLPRVPASLAADVALACWLLACTIAAWRAGRRRSIGSAAAGMLVALSVCASWLAVGMDESAQARNLFVAERGASLFTAPALDAERTQRLDAGEVGAAVARQGVWTRLRLDGDREGWVESARLVSIARR